MASFGSSLRRAVICLPLSTNLMFPLYQVYKSDFESLSRLGHFYQNSPSSPQGRVVGIGNEAMETQDTLIVLNLDFIQDTWKERLYRTKRFGRMNS